MVEELNKEDCTIGMSANDEVCIITIPLRKYTFDDINGVALIYGKMRELQAHVMQISNQMKIKQAQRNGILKAPNGLSVH